MVGHDRTVSPAPAPAADGAARVLVVGDANPDLVLSGDVVPRFGQAEQLLDEADLVIGGSGAIIAHGLARLGRPVSLVAAVGDDHVRRPSSPSGSARPGSTYATSRSAPDLPTGLTVVLNRRRRPRDAHPPGAIPTPSPDPTVDGALDRAVPTGPATCTWLVLPARRASLPVLPAVLLEARGPAA